MIAESEDGPGELRAWVKGVKALRYKDFRLEKMSDGLTSSGGRLGVNDGDVLEIGDLKEFGELMGKWGLREWWRAGMGWS